MPAETIGAVVVSRDAAGAIAAAYERVPAPGTPGPGELLIATDYVGICGSDLEQLRGQMPETFLINYPHVLGHEWSGTVLAAGPGADGFAVGAKVIGHGDLGGNAWFGVTVDGAMADTFTVPAHMCFAVPAGISQITAAVVEPLACVLTALRTTRFLSAADQVNIFGLGAIGLSAVMLTSLSGAAVRAFDPSEVRRAKALELGATDAADPSVSPATGFGLADLVIEASGSPVAQAAAIESAAEGATVLMMGVSRPREATVSLGLIQQRNLTIISSTGAPAQTWGAALTLVDRASLDLAAIVSTIVPFAECRDAFAAAERPGDQIKILLTP